MLSVLLHQHDPRLLIAMLVSGTGADRVCTCFRFYKKALSCIPGLRGACVEHNKGQVFNTFLEQMASKYEQDQLRADFWRKVTDDQISLVSSDEASDVQTSNQQSEDFLISHTHQQQVMIVFTLAMHAANNA